MHELEPEPELVAVAVAVVVALGPFQVVLVSVEATVHVRRYVGQMKPAELE